MPIVTVFAIPLFSFTITGRVAFSPSSNAKQEPGRRNAIVKPAKHNEGRSMDEDSPNAVGER